MALCLTSDGKKREKSSSFGSAGAVSNGVDTFIYCAEEAVASGREKNSSRKEEERALDLVFLSVGGAFSAYVAGPFQLKLAAKEEIVALFWGRRIIAAFCALEKCQKVISFGNGKAETSEWECGGLGFLKREEKVRGNRVHRATGHFLGFSTFRDLSVPSVCPSGVCVDFY